MAAEAPERCVSHPCADAANVLLLKRLSEVGVEHARMLED